MTDCIGLVYAKFEIELSRPIWSNAECDENKTGQRHNLLYRCSYTKKKIELSWSIGLGAVCDENKIGQWHD